MLYYNYENSDLIWTIAAKFSDRTILTLETLKKAEILNSDFVSIPGSPVTLAQLIIYRCFTNSGEPLKSYRDRLDSIKRMTLGLSSAEKGGGLIPSSRGQAAC